MRTVWILNHYAQELKGPGGTRHYNLAKHLPTFGYCAYILAASVEFNTGRQRLNPGEKIRLTPLEDTIGGFLWIRTPTYRGNGPRRVMNMLVYAFRSVLRSTTCGIPKPDIVVGSSVHLLAAIAGLRLARRYGVPFIFEVRDLWPQTLIDIGNLKPERPVTRILQSMEKWIYRNSDKIVTLLPYAVDYIVSLGINNKQIEWIPNGVDLASFPEPPPPPQRETFTLMYFGAHGNANGLESILEAMSRLQDRKPEPKIHLRLVGDGFQKPALMQKAQKMGLRNVSFEAPVQKSFIPVLAGDADAFVFSLVKAPVFRYGISPNKLFDFMASARPIIFYSDAMNNPVRDAGAGLTVMPEDPEALAEAMIKLQSTPLHLRHEMGRAGRRYIEEHHDFRKLAQKFAKILYELQETHKNRSNKAVL